MSVITIIQELTGPEIKTLEAEATTEPEERIRTIPYQKLEDLYFISGLVQQIINKHVEKITGQGGFFIGPEALVKDYEEWAKGYV